MLGERKCDIVWNGSTKEGLDMVTPELNNTWSAHQIGMAQILDT